MSIKAHDRAIRARLSRAVDYAALSMLALSMVAAFVYLG